MLFVFWGAPLPGSLGSRCCVSRVGLPWRGQSLGLGQLESETEVSVGGVQIGEAAAGGCSGRPFGFRLGELWQQALIHPGQGTKRDFGSGEWSGIWACV